MTLVLLPPSIDDELDERKCWREGTSEWSVTGCVPITGAQGCWEDVGLCHVIAWMRGPMAGAKYGRLNTHRWAPRSKKKGKPLTLTNPPILPHCIQRTFVCIDSLMVMATVMMLVEAPAAFRWLMSSVIFSCSFLPPLESIGCTSPTDINVMPATVRALENRTASTVLPFFAEFYCLCLSHLQALVHKCSCVLSIRFYQLCGVDCTRRSLKVTVPPWAAAIRTDILIYPSRPFYWYNISISHNPECLNRFDGWLIATVWGFLTSLLGSNSYSWWQHSGNYPGETLIQASLASYVHLNVDHPQVFTKPREALRSLAKNFRS